MTATVATLTATPHFYDQVRQALLDAGYHHAFMSNGLIDMNGICLELSSPEITGCHKLDTSRQVFFYEQDFYILSNFSSFRVSIWGVDFDTAEHAYHWRKFYFDGAGHRVAQIREEIQRARSAHDALKIAEAAKSERDPNWDAIKLGVMLQVIMAKADQHEYVRRKLLATGDRELIEDSWRDDFWGWGPSRGGRNMLGKLWMQVRAELRGASTP